MNNKRKKITAYLHPDIYPQDKLTESFVENLPSQMRGDFYRQSIICGAALCKLDPRIITMISNFFSDEITAESVIKIIEQVTGYKSQSVDIEYLEKIITESRNKSFHSEKESESQQEEMALRNLSKFKL